MQLDESYKPVLNAYDQDSSLLIATLFHKNVSLIIAPVMKAMCAPKAADPLPNAIF